MCGAVQQIRILRGLAFAATAAVIAQLLITLWVIAVPELTWQLWTADVIDRNLAFRLRYWQVPEALTMGAFMAGAVLFLLWLHVARRNVSVTAEAPRLLHYGWLVPMWVIPVANLLLPGLFVARIAEVSTAEPVVSPSRAGLRRLVWAWWIAWAIPSAFDWATYTFAAASYGFAEFDWTVYVGIRALYIISGVLAIVMIFKITSAQRALFLGRLPVANPGDFPAFTVGEIPAEGATRSDAAR
jgi:hypothetical protein